MSFIQVKGHAVRTYRRVCSGTNDEETCPFIVLTTNLISNPSRFLDEIVSEGMPVGVQAPFRNTLPDRILLEINVVVSLDSSKNPMGKYEEYVYVCDLNKSLCHWYPIKNPSGENIGDTT